MQLLSVSATAAILGSAAVLALPSGNWATDLEKRDPTTLYDVPDGMTHYTCGDGRFIMGDDIQRVFNNIDKNGIDTKHTQTFSVMGLKNTKYPKSFKNSDHYIPTSSMGHCDKPGKHTSWEEFPIRDHGDKSTGVYVNRMLYQRSKHSTDTVKFHLCGIITHDGPDQKKDKWRACNVATVADTNLEMSVNELGKTGEGAKKEEGIPAGWDVEDYEDWGGDDDDGVVDDNVDDLGGDDSDDLGGEDAEDFGVTIGFETK